MTAFRNVGKAYYAHQKKKQFLQIASSNSDMNLPTPLFHSTFRSMKKKSIHFKQTELFFNFYH